MEFCAVVMTYLEPYFINAVESINAQTVPATSKILLVDSRHSEKLADLDDSSLDRLSGWAINVHDPQGDWASHRNHAIDSIPQGTWVFMLDDDEVVTKGFLESAQLVISHSSQELDAIRIPRINSFNGLEGVAIDWLRPDGFMYPDLQSRVFKVKPGLRYVGRVHEVLSGEACATVSLAPSMTLLHAKTAAMQQLSTELWSSLTGLVEPFLSSIDTDTQTARFYSQCGEDAYLAEMLPRLVGVPKTVAELGAGDPIDLSNSRYLIEQGWSALLVEANPAVSDRLQREYIADPRITIVESLLGPDDLPAVEFHVSRIHWALSGVGGVSQSERHGMGDVQIMQVPQQRASQLIRSWVEATGGTTLGVLGIDLEGLDTEVLNEILDTGERPCVIIVEALTHVERAKQHQILGLAGYDFETTLALSDIWVHRSVLRLV